MLWQIKLRSKTSEYRQTISIAPKFY